MSTEHAMNPLDEAALARLRKQARAARNTRRYVTVHFDELLALLDMVERQGELLREVAFDDYKRETVTDRNAFEFFGKCNQRLCYLRDKAKALTGAASSTEERA